jgi:hypothetical protein
MRRRLPADPRCLRCSVEVGEFALPLLGETRFHSYPEEAATTNSNPW